MVLFPFARVGIACCIGLLALVLPAVSAAQSRDSLSREHRRIVSKYLSGPDGLSLQKDEGYYFLDPSPSRTEFVTCLIDETCGKKKRIAPLTDRENFNMSLKDWDRLNLTFGTSVAVAKTSRLAVELIPPSDEDDPFVNTLVRAPLQDGLAQYIEGISDNHAIAGCLDAVAADRRNHAPERLEAPLMRAVIACAILLEDTFYLAYATSSLYQVTQILEKRGVSGANLMSAGVRWKTMVEEGVKGWTVIK